MADTPKKPSTRTRPTLAAAASAIKKNILGADTARPATIKLPQAVSEIHVSPTDVIPAGTVITDEIAELADLDDTDLADLMVAGHVKYVEVYATAFGPADDQAA